MHWICHIKIYFFKFNFIQLEHIIRFGSHIFFLLNQDYKIIVKSSKNFKAKFSVILHFESKYKD